MASTGRYSATAVQDASATVTAVEADTNILDVKVSGATVPQAGAGNVASEISNNVVHFVVTTDADVDSTSVVAAHTDTLDEVGNITDSQTAFTVDAGAGWPTAPFTIIMGTEQMRVTDVTTNEFTVTRGYDGTTAAVHNDGATITHYIDEATTVFDLDAGGVLEAGDLFKIGTAGTELIQVVSVSTNRITVVRGYLSTTAAVIADAGEIWKVFGDVETLDAMVAEADVYLEESIWGGPTVAIG